MHKNPDNSPGRFGQFPNQDGSSGLFQSGRDWRLETKVPIERVADLAWWSPDRLHQEAHTVSSILRRFAEAVADSVNDPDSSRRFLSELDLKSISQDHDWQEAFEAIAREGGSADRQVLIARYLEYLSFRKKLIDYISDKKSSLETTDGHQDITVGAPESFERLVMGEMVEIRIPEGRIVDIVLGRHIFQIEGGAWPELVDPYGHRQAISEGPNRVGRHPESDIPTPQELRRVSRLHCILWGLDKDRVAVMDLSSTGTYLKPDED